MTRNATLFVTLLVATLLWGSSSALAGYNGSTMAYNVVAGTYSEVSGGTVHATGNSIQGFGATVTMPFSFNFNGSSSNQVTVYSDGYVNLGSGGTIRAWQNYLTGTANGELSTTTLGSSPNQVFVIQWKNVTRAPQNSTSDVFNFQIRLEQATGRASVVYGAMYASAAMGAGIGANSYNGEINLHTSYWHNSWMYPRSNTFMESMAAQNWAPASGLTYVFGAATSNDAAITGIDNPSDKFNAGTTQTIQVRLKNFGTNRLDSVVINWTINGTTRTPVKYYPQPALQPGEEATVQLGTATFGTNSFNTLMIRTSAPNGATDANAGNDTYLGYLAPRVTGRLNIALNGNSGVFGSFNDCVRHLVTSGIGGNVNVHVFSGNYDQQILIPQFDNGLAGGTVTFMAAANNAPVISWASMNNPWTWWGFYEQSSSQATLYNSTPVAFENITFRLPQDAQWGSAILGETYGSVSIDDCTFEGPDAPLSMTTSSFGIRLYSNSYGTMYSIMDNMFENLPYSINVSDYNNSNSVAIAHNTVNGAIEGIWSNGIGLSVHHNNVTAISGSGYFVGIGLYGSGAAEKNMVSGDLSATPGSTVYGMYLEPGYGAFSGVNNMIGVGATGSAYGVYTYQPNYTVNLYHNSVNVTGTAAGNSFALNAYVETLFNSSSKVNSVNNIFHNAGNGSNGGYAVYMSGSYNNTSANPFLSADFNNLMTTGTNVGYFNGNRTRVAGSNPLVNWKAATARDNNSRSVAVNFTGGTDLHLLSVDRNLFGASNMIATVSTDIDGDARVIPYMGADEIKPSVMIIQQPISRYACLGESFNLICVADVTNGSDVTYQWYKDGVELTGQTGAILVFSNIGYGASGVYTCLVKATDGYNLVEVMSDEASVIVVRQTQITSNPVSQPVALGGTAVLEVTAEAIGAPTDFVPSYQWKKRYWSNTAVAYVDTNIVDNGRITGAQSSQLTIRDVTLTDTMDTYVCEVTGYCGNATSKPARLFIPIVAASNNTPNACAGGLIQIECAVYPSSIPGSSVSYQWYFNGVALTNGGNIAGATSKVLEISAATSANAGDYLCHAIYDGVGVEVPSNTITVEIGTAPAITNEPVGDTVCEGATVTMSVAGSGVNLGYQWLKGTTAIPGATSATLEITATVADAGSYSVVVSNACGSATSTAVDLLVNTAASITTQPSDVAVYDGDMITLTVAASGTEPITYQWFRNDTALAGATAATFQTTASASGNDAGEYTCIVTNACGSDTSDAATVGVTVGVDEEVYAGGYGLSVASPNPTSDVVSFTYTVPASQNVRIALTNVLGNEVATIVNERIDAGTHRVEVSSANLNLAPGVYTYTITSNGFMAAQQFVIVK